MFVRGITITRVVQVRWRDRRAIFISIMVTGSSASHWLNVY